LRIDFREKYLGIFTVTFSLRGKMEEAQGNILFFPVGFERR
jgi:hypothetical protein